MHNLPEICVSLYFRSSFSSPALQTAQACFILYNTTADGALNSSATDTSAEPTLIRTQAEYTGPRPHLRVDRLGQLKKDRGVARRFRRKSVGLSIGLQTSPLRHSQVWDAAVRPAQIRLRTRTAPNRTLGQVRFGVRFSTVLGGPVWGSACARYGPNQTSPRTSMG